MKRFLLKLKYNIINVPLQFIFMILNLLIGLSCIIYCALTESLLTTVISLITLFPFVISLIILNKIVRNKNKKSVKIILNLLIIILIIPMLLLHLINILIVSLFSVDNDYPITELKDYKKVYKRFKDTEIGKYLPKDISKYPNTTLYYQEGFLQGATILEIEIKLDKEKYNEYQEKLKNIRNDMDKQVIKEISSDSEYVDKYKQEKYKTYYLEANCDNSGYCNHGKDEHIAISDNSLKIIFYYSDW